MRKIPIVFFILAFFLTSCASSRKILYFQDAEAGIARQIDEMPVATIQPRDVLSIVISSRDPELALLFNKQQLGLTGEQDGTASMLDYEVSGDGRIELPVLGVLRVQGMTREQLTGTIRTRLIDEKLLLDPVVTIRFVNFRISVIGEVNAPGTYTMDRDHITLLDALGQARDLTINGKRSRVAVIREIAGQRTFHYVDLRSVELFNSPAYYLQQNDVVYVEPNRARAGQSSVNENSFKSASFWMSLASFITTMALLIF